MFNTQCVSRSRTYCMHYQPIYMFTGWSSVRQLVVKQHFKEGGVGDLPQPIHILGLALGYHTSRVWLSITGYYELQVQGRKQRRRNPRRITSLAAPLASPTFLPPLFLLGFLNFYEQFPCINSCNPNWCSRGVNPCGTLTISQPNRFNRNHIY